VRHCLPDETGHDLISEGHRLGLRCTQCRRNVVPGYSQIGVHGHDYRNLRRLNLVCSCGSRDVERVVLETPDEVDAFLQGERPRRSHSENVLRSGWMRPEAGPRFSRKSMDRLRLASRPWAVDEHRPPTPPTRGSEVSRHSS